jgi:hypothetical protein
MKKDNPRHVVTEKCRLSYAHLIKPYMRPGATEEKYSVTVLLPKSDVVTKSRIDAAIEAAISEGVAQWGGRPPKVALPVHDGDGQRESDGMPFGPECQGCWVFTASCKVDKPPRIVDRNVQDILDPREIYSGIFGKVGCDFFAYNSNGKKGIGCGLTNVQKLADGEPLGNRTSAEEDFGAPAQAPQYAQPAYAQPAYQQPQYTAPQYAPPQQYAQPAYPAPQYAQPGGINPVTGLPF